MTSERLRPGFGRGGGRVRREGGGAKATGCLRRLVWRRLGAGGAGGLWWARSPPQGGCCGRANGFIAGGYTRTRRRRDRAQLGAPRRSHVQCRGSARAEGEVASMDDGPRLGLAPLKAQAQWGQPLRSQAPITAAAMSAPRWKSRRWSRQPPGEEGPALQGAAGQALEDGRGSAGGRSGRWCRRGGRGGRTVRERRWCGLEGARRRTRGTRRPIRRTAGAESFVAEEGGESAPPERGGAHRLSAKLAAGQSQRRQGGWGHDRRCVAAGDVEASLPVAPAAVATASVHRSVVGFGGLRATVAGDERGDVAAGAATPAPLLPPAIRSAVAVAPGGAGAQAATAVDVPATVAATGSGSITRADRKSVV